MEKGVTKILSILGLLGFLYAMPVTGYAADLTVGATISGTGNMTLNGAMTATSLSGNGAGLTNLDPAKLSAGTAGINISGNAATATTADGVVTGGVTNVMLQNPSVTVSAGVGMTGGGTVSLGGSTTLNVNFAGTGSLTTAAKSDHNHNATYVQALQLDCVGGRYEDNGDGTVSDCRTGLIWLKNANCTDTAGEIVKGSGSLSWANAGTWAAGLGNGLCGLTDGSYAGDWRLPTKTEWMAMVQSARKHGYNSPSLTNAAGTGHWAAGDIFDTVQSGDYWSGSSVGTLNAWVVDMNLGSAFNAYKNGFFFYVWPVRSGQ